jgi:hypothetical protein
LSWDSLAYSWYCGNRDRSKGGEDLEMQDVMFETLVQILALPSEACQEAALHGLGHLHHPDSEKAVQTIRREKGIPKALREYALAAARFRVM